MKVSDVLTDKLKQFEGIGLRRIGVLHNSMGWLCLWIIKKNKI